MQKKNARHSVFIDFSSSFWKNKTILIDSRKILFPKESIFFAIKGNLTDGHLFIHSLYEQGVRCFVHSQSVDTSLYPEAQFIHVKDVVQVLQDFAHHHRQQFDIPVLAITGSNAKTILKEWLFLLLEQDFIIIKSPKSYNSQIGVPLSVLGMNTQHELGIFEAGISQVGEMQQLQTIIQPSLGIFTNIGKAHASGFETQEEKIREKLSLFKDCDAIIYKIEHQKIHQEIQVFDQNKLWSWGASKDAKIPIYTQITPNHSVVSIHWKGKIHDLKIPFTNSAAIENCLHGIATLLYLGIDIDSLENRIKKLRDVPMRMELKEGINSCQIIDDSYNNDFEGLKIALDFLNQKHKQSPSYTKTLILSDIPEVNQSKQYSLIAQLIQEHQIQKLIGIGPILCQKKSLFKAIPDSHFFENTNEFIQAIDKTIHFRQESILLKGARAFEFERIAQQLKKRIHGTVLEINLGAITHNLQVYKNLLHPNTKMMVMVKASAYGSGSYEIAQLLQYNHVDYLGVAYVDEGVALRQHGIKLPIMVMNTAIHEFEVLCQYNLEPVVYSLAMLEQFSQYIAQSAKATAYPIHLEFDTGMHRLGFVKKDIDILILELKKAQKHIHIAGLFSHLAASDETQHEAFTNEQIESFKDLATQIENALQIKSIKHILNSAGISRFPSQQLDLVRLGIGLYGIDPNKRLPMLKNVAQLKTCISQIKVLQKGETIGYSRKGKILKTSRVAILAIGYADGFLRAFGNGNFSVKIQNKLAPTIGNICMDMCFVDISNIPEAKEGDEVIIFDSIEGIETLAEATNTIPYEILTNISDRVPRVFYVD